MSQQTRANLKKYALDRDQLLDSVKTWADDYSAQDAITAFAGGGQASATALTGKICNVTTVASAGDSVKLPASADIGTEVSVRNSAAVNAMDIFPATGDSINALSANTALSLAAGAGLIFRKITSTKWVSH